MFQSTATPSTKFCVILDTLNYTAAQKQDITAKLQYGNWYFYPRRFV